MQEGTIFSPDSGEHASRPGNGWPSREMFERR